MIDAVVQWASGAMEQGGLLALAAMLLIENLFPPIPSEAVLPLGGLLVSDGTFTLAAALAASTAGSVAGAWVIYALGRYGGRPLVMRFHTVLRFTEEELDRADDWFDQHGSWVVFWARMLPFLRSVVSVPAGASEMPLVRFTVLTAAGSLIWNALLIGAGIVLGENYSVIIPWLDRFTWLVVAVCVVALAWWIVRRVRSRSR